MKYLVMETHPAYAVVLDERGRFLKTANLHYQVGQTVQDVVELRLPPPGVRSGCGPRWPRLLWLPACAWAFSAITGPTSPPMAPCASRSTRMWR